jgi:hypothetical protein
MKTLQNIFKITAGVLIISAVAVSCLPKEESMGTAGQTLVKLVPAGFNMVPMDAKTTAQTAVLFDVRRDVQSKDALNTNTTVELTYDASGAILAKYNSKNATSFIPLPTSLATTTPAISGGKISFDIPAGEFAKSIVVNVPSAASFDFSKQYALAFKLTTVSGTGTKAASVNDTIVVQVLAKNKYDGKYVVTGSFDDYVYNAGGTTYAGIYPKNINLETIGSASVKRFDADYGTYGYIFDAGGATYFGNFYPAFTFDANNNVIDCYNTFTDPLPRGRSGVLYTGAGAINKYNPTTKTIDVTFQLKQLTVSPQLRNLITEHYVYAGAR